MTFGRHLREHIGQPLADVEIQQIIGLRPDLRFGQVAVAQIPAGGQHVSDPGHQAPAAVSIQADAQGDLVGREKADSIKIPGQPVRIVGDNGDGRITIGLVDPHGKKGADAVGLQKHHDIANGAVFDPGRLDAFQFFLGNTRNLGKPLDIAFKDL